ncbi:hypothetical protein V8E52_004275 [Russula decolorans]
MLLSANRASPVSIGGPPDHENDLAGHDQPSDPEIAVTQDDLLALEDISDDVPDPADVADADAYEDLIHNNLATIDSEPDQTAIGEAPELTEQEDPSAIGDHGDLTSPQGMPTVIVDQFPFGSPGMPIPDKP